MHGQRTPSYRHSMQDLTGRGRLTLFEGTAPSTTTAEAVEGVLGLESSQSSSGVVSMAAVRDESGIAMTRLPMSGPPVIFPYFSSLSAGQLDGNTKSSELTRNMGFGNVPRAALLALHSDSPDPQMDGAC